MTAKRPNILLLSSDQHAYKTGGWAGDPVVQTPHIDRLAREGVDFTHAHTNAPLCFPARANLLTGRAVHNHGVQVNFRGIMPQERTLPQLMQAAGYHTAMLGKTHFVYYGAARPSDLADNEEQMRRFGFDDCMEAEGKMEAVRMLGPYTRHLKARGLYDVFAADYNRRLKALPAFASYPSVLPEEDFEDAWIGAMAADWIRNYRAEQPFFAWVSWVGPHDPWDAPGHYGDMYHPADMPAAIPYKPESGSSYEHGLRQAILTSKNPEGLPLDEAAIARIKAQYYGMVTLLDDAVGNIMQALTDRGMLEDTLVIFTSDHGEMLGDHGLLTKCVFYESCVRIPMVMRWGAGGARNIKHDAFVGWTDLLPTLLDLAGARIPDRIDGRSFAPLIQGGHDGVDRDVIFSELDHRRMIRTRTHKYIHSPIASERALYDLHNDPDEMRNRIDDPGCAGVQRDLMRRLMDWLIASNRPLNDEKLDTGGVHDQSRDSGE